jgi:outer membrane protein, heavy metal efflux system
MSRVFVQIGMLFIASSLFAQQTLDLHQAFQIVLQNSPQAAFLQKQKEVAEAQIKVEEQRNNPSFIAEDTRSEPNYFVGAGYLFELGGKRSKRIDVARNEAAIAAADYRKGLFDLRREVRLAFFGLLQANEKQKELSASRDLATRLRDVAQQRFEAGEVARLEVLSAEVEMKQRENEARQADAEQQAALMELNALLNRSLQDQLQLSTTLEQQPAALNLDWLIARGMAQNYELQSVLQEMKAEEARLALVRAERVPDLDTEGGTEIHDAEHQYGWRFSLRMELPIFNRKSGEIFHSNAQLAALKAQQQVTEQKLRAAISGAYIKYQAASFQAQNYTTQILPEAQELEQLAEDSYKEGKTGILSVIEAQRNVRQIRLEYLDALMQLQTAISDLETAAGVELE